MKKLSIKEIAKAVNGEIIHGSDQISITSVSTNSKDIISGALFVPIVGEKNDAHLFIEDAYKNGAVACFTSRTDIYHENITCIKVEDTLKALQALGAYYRSLFNIPVVGITGSVGKTTTKEMISAALGTKYNVLKTAGNMNSQVGLPLMMLRIEEEHEIAVIEMGMSEEGEMARLARIAKPDVAVVTNIGVSHIGQLKSQENIRKEKLNIINEFHKDSVLFVNGNDSLLKKLSIYSKELSLKDKEKSQNFDRIDLSDDTLSKFKEAPVISFGTDDSCEYRADNTRVINGKTYFTLKSSVSHVEGDKNTVGITEEEIVLNVLGQHNVYNALCALAIANHYNIPISVAKIGLENYRPIAMRGEIIEANGIKIIDDTYNASPDSMKGGIQVLLALENVRKRIAVLADVLELGEISEKCHYDVGVYISDKNIDEVVTIGTQAGYIAKAIAEHNKSILTHSYSKNEEAITYLKNTLKVGDALLVKGSRSMKTEEIVKAFS